LVKKLVKVALVGVGVAVVAALGYVAVAYHGGEKPEAILRDARRRVRDAGESVDAARERADEAVREVRDRTDRLSERARKAADKVSDKARRLEEHLP
jgi:hypothetical protein